MVSGDTPAAWQRNYNVEIGALSVIVNAVKAALTHVAKGLSHELAPGGVRVNIVSPGPTYSKDGIWAKINIEDPDRVRKAIHAIPLRRMATPEEIANMAVFLCSRRAPFVIGANIIVDGGRSTRKFKKHLSDRS